MPSCERIPLNQFHSRKSRLNTETCVRNLTQSKQFQDYVKHVEYDEYLQMTWFIAPIGLTIAFYYHLLFVLYDAHAGPKAAAFSKPPFFFEATAILVFFVAPCVVVSQFSGFFEPLPRRRAMGLILILTCINISVVAFGGRSFHNPPYLVTNLPLPWFSSTTSQLKPLVMDTLKRALPLQGSVVGGWMVYEWRQVRWRSAWHLPLPLLTVPVLLGVFSCLWFCITSRFLSLFLNDGDENGVSDYVTGFFPTLVSVMQQEFVDMATGPLPPRAFTDVSECHRIWWSVLLLSILYFAGVLLPVICVIFRGLYRLLPTHPTTWSISFVACVMRLAAVVRVDDANVLQLLLILAVILMLLHNGPLVSP